MTLSSTRSAQRSEKVAALFDVDRTLVNVNSARLYVRHRMEQSQSSWFDYLRVSGALLQYVFGTLKIEHAAREALSNLRGLSEQQMREECLGWYARTMRPHISAHGRREVERRRNEGAVCAILSASTPYLVEPLAAELGIDHVLCTRLEVNDGLFTGGWEAPLCYGAGKVERATAWAASHGIDLVRSSFYTDSISDLPMLEAVGSPRVINPDPRLRFVAARRRYPVENWK